MSFQISPNTEPETVNRVYKIQAQRYHSDNPEIDDLERFVLLNQARGNHALYVVPSSLISEIP